MQPVPLLMLASIAVSAGCRNSPGDLELRVQPEKQVFSSANPLRLRVTLAANEGPLCLDREPVFAVRLARAGSAEELRAMEPFGACGNPYLLLLPLLPIVLAVEKLDVGDCLGRFTVMPKGTVRVWELQVIPRAKDIYVVKTDSSLTPGFAQQGGELPPGHYRLRCEVVPTSSFPPLTWTRYDQPLAGDAEFDIAGETEAP